MEAPSTGPTMRSIPKIANSSTGFPIWTSGSVLWEAWCGRPSFAKISNKATRLIVDGFNFSSIVVVSTGQPIYSGSSSGYGAQINGFASGGPEGGLTGAHVNNSGTGVGGRVPGARNPFTGPGLANVDFRIGRQFVIQAFVRRRSVQCVQLHELLHREQHPIQFFGGRRRGLRWTQ